MVTTRLQEKLGQETPNSSGTENISSAKGSPSVSRASRGRGTPTKTEPKNATASKSSSKISIEIGPSPLSQQHATPGADDRKELPERLKSPSTFYTPGKTPTANKRKRFASDEPEEDSILDTFKTPAEYPRTHNEIPSTEDEDDDDDDAPEVLSSKTTPLKARGAPTTRSGRGSGRKRRKAATDVADDSSTIDVARTQPTPDEALAEAEAEANGGVSSDATAVGDQVDATRIPSNTTTTNQPMEETNAAISHEEPLAIADPSAAVDSVDDPQSASLEDLPDSLEDTITIMSVPEATDMDSQRKTAAAAADADKLESMETPVEHMSSALDSAIIPGSAPNADADAGPEVETEGKVSAPSSTRLPPSQELPSDSAPASLPEPSATNLNTTSHSSSEHIPASAIRTTAITATPQSNSHSHSNLNLNKAKSVKKISSTSTRQRPASALLREHLPKPKPTPLQDFRTRLLNRHPRTTNFGPPDHKRVKFVGA
ncbi:hypothetical protein LTR99_008191 [Exophiala xenobiotica]|uniref:Shugoshin C-terminal domain-containing protein n=1 Tax=Vermiconidia calcicola TaxID=1690605 RepID=A0AAV9QID7_9PEZI|nr:hypothetical protein LTR96_008587 [Exophiala xenobiotica]KAK5539404.1 hypothetical protein LTR23_006625 [Chaetothyriales sp. CCFEE 6169]KAK5543510.1 hypothetical protein LTR25_001124 [Vermiconidia calcicola]KAK5297788.1 hypothetical protein LTR99_008191 [Exophiala xenobiotica]KAK5337833.1 hypothetical protein LTR98_005682 [Exophiala xenobiotica]